MFVAVLLFHSLLLMGRVQPECPDAASCREVALAAAERKDYETFHDLAWRAVQKGRPNEAELLMMLARAQSLSGRPGDALVMLRRLAEMGVVIDAAESEDFRRVRALPGWPAVEALIAASRERPAAADARSAETANSSARTPAVKSSPVSGAKLESAVPPRRTPPETATALLAPGAASGGEEALRMPAVGIDPIGLAYDSASRRFVVGDRRHNKVLVADEVFKRVNDLVGAGSGGFGALTALEVDRRRGDLWVTSSGDGGSASLHKLQLVSGRVLATIEVPEPQRPAIIGDMSVSDTGALLLVDTAGARLFSMSTAERFDRPLPLGIASPSSIASSGSTAYVAHEAGLSVVDVKTGSIAAVRSGEGVSLDGLKRIRWHRGAIVAIQGIAGGTTRLVRIRLSRSGKTASRLEVLDDQTPADGAALTVIIDAAYYLAHAEDGLVIRKVVLR